MNNRTLSFLIILALSFCFVTCSTSKSAKNTSKKSMREIYSATWTLVSINSSLTGEETIPPADKITINFTQEGKVSGSGGCNRFSGKFELNENKLVIGDLISTRRACEILNLESFVMNVLKEIDDFSIADNKLFLKKEGQILLTYVKQAVEQLND